MLKFWEIPESPNSVKVRLALLFKGIPFKARSVQRDDPAPLLQIADQEVAPVIEDKGIVLGEGETILHYLDANYRETPRLFARDRDGRNLNAAWADRIDRKLSEAWAPAYLFATGRTDEYPDDAADSFQAGLRKVQKRMHDELSFNPDAPIDDLRVALWLAYAMPSDAMVERVPTFGKTRDLFGIAPGTYPALEAFVARWNAFLA